MMERGDSSAVMIGPPWALVSFLRLELTGRVQFNDDGDDVDYGEMGLFGD